MVRFTCRGSGTEPKLKLYVEGKSVKNEKSATDIAVKCWDTLKEQWFKPDQFNLKEVRP